MFDALFGNRTAAKVLTFISINREAYAKEISDRTEISLNLVQSQLQRLERGGVLVSKPRGRMRFYSFNPRLPITDNLQEMLQQAIDYLPEEERAAYVARRRPRAPGDPL